MKTKPVKIECACCGKKITNYKEVNFTTNKDPHHVIYVCQKCYDEMFYPQYVKKALDISLKTGDKK